MKPHAFAPQSHTCRSPNRTPALATKRSHRSLLGVCLLVAFSAAAATAWSQEKPRTITLDVFIRPDSTRCQAAADFASALAKERSGVEVRVHDVVADRAQLERYWFLVKHYKITNAGLPAFFTCGQFKVGFSDAATSGQGVRDLVTLHAYVREGCGRCREAKAFLSRLSTRWPGLRIVYHDVVADPRELDRMNELARRYGVAVTGMPVILVAGQLHVGWRGETLSGRDIENSLLQKEPKEDRSKTPVKPSAFRTAALTRWVSYRAEEPAALPDEADAPAIKIDRDPPPGEIPEAVDDTEAPAKAESEPARRDSIELPWLGVVRVSDMGMPTFTLVIGLVDGFNPCAMWVLVFLLSVLVNVKDRWKILAIAGTFVLISGLAYFTFMAAWLNVFALVGIARPVQIVLGCLAILIGAIDVKDFFAFKKGLTLSIPESLKPGIYDRVRKIVATKYLGAAVGAAVVLAILVNTIELLCTAGLPALYTQVLTFQQLPAWKNYAYLLLYNGAYMADDALVLSGFVWTLSHRKLQEREGRWLKAVSGLVILALGLTMIFRPQWLHFNAVD